VPWASGDAAHGRSRSPAHALARAVGIEDVIAGASRRSRGRLTRSWRAAKRVAMVGDGINDAAGARQGHARVAMGSAQTSRCSGGRHAASPRTRVRCAGAGARASCALPMRMTVCGPRYNVMYPARRGRALWALWLLLRPASRAWPWRALGQRALEQSDLRSFTSERSEVVKRRSRSRSNPPRRSSRPRHPRRSVTRRAST